MVVKKKPAQAIQNDEFVYVMDLCRSAVNSGDEVLRHFVQRFLDYLVASGNDKRAGEIRRLLSNKARMLNLTPRRLVRSRAMPAVEELSRAVRPPIDKETALSTGRCNIIGVAADREGKCDDGSTWIVIGAEAGTVDALARRCFVQRDCP